MCSLQGRSQCEHPAVLQDDFLSSFDQKYLPAIVPEISSLRFETMAESDSPREVLPEAHDKATVPESSFQ